jgi:hypothetical protein
VGSDAFRRRFLWACYPAIAVSAMISRRHVVCFKRCNARVQTSTVLFYMIAGPKKKE